MQPLLDMTSRTADTSAPVHPLIAGRWSPRAFDPDHELDDLTLASLLEAARWAPSGGNGQPWRFVVARRGTALFAQVFDTLAGGNRRWAGSASALVVALADERRSDGRPNPWAAYDLGAAVALLTVQAHDLGLHVHQMAGFDAGALAGVLDPPEGLRAYTVSAIGRVGDPGALPDDLRAREAARRSRRPLGELVRAAPWGDRPVA